MTSIKDAIGLEMQIARLRRYENLGFQLYSPIFINRQLVSITKLIHEQAKPIEYDDLVFIALCEKANNAGVPFFLIRYDDELAWFYVTPGNTQARTLLTAAVYLNRAELLEMFGHCRSL
jgi:hypothetical protein